jgi:hypothetical protein
METEAREFRWFLLWVLKACRRQFRWNLSLDFLTDDYAPRSLDVGLGWGDPSCDATSQQVSSRPAIPYRDWRGVVGDSWGLAEKILEPSGWADIAPQHPLRSHPEFLVDQDDVLLPLGCLWGLMERRFNRASVASPSR